jgi:probable O-glycosylation ligase (exosortase A-associated)
VGLIAVAGLMFLQIRQRLALVPVIAVAAVLGVAFAPQAWRDRMATLESGQLDSSAMERINAWTFAWRLAGDSPLTGGGFDTFTTDLFKRYAPDTRDVHTAHSVYFGVLAEHGFPGLFLYMTLVLAAFFTTFMISRRARLYGDEKALAYSQMFRLSMVGFLTSGLFLGRAYFDYYFTIVACISTLRHICEQSWAEGDVIAETAPKIEEDADSGELAWAGE